MTIRNNATFLRGAVTAFAALVIGGFRFAGVAAPGSTATERPELVIQIGHVNPVDALAAVTVRGRPCVVSAGYDGTVRLFDVQVRLLNRVLLGHTGPVEAVAALTPPDGGDAIAATGGDDRTVRVWDLVRGTALEKFSCRCNEGSNRVTAVALQPGGALLAAGTDSATSGGDGFETLRPGQNLWIWNRKTGKAVRTTTAHAGGVNAVAFSPDGRLLATGGGRAAEFAYCSGAEGADNLALWDAATGVLRRRLSGPRDGVNAVAFSSDGKLLASGGTDKIIRLWDTATGALVRTIVGSVSTIEGLTFTAGGRLLVGVSGGGSSATSGGAVGVWEVATGNSLLGKNANLTARCIAASADDQTLIGGGEDGALLTWSTATLGDTALPLDYFHGVESGVRPVALRPDGAFAATISAPIATYINDHEADGRRINSSRAAVSRQVDVWNLATGEIQAALQQVKETKDIFSGDASTKSLAFSPNGKYLATGVQNRNSGGMVRLWDGHTFQLLRSLPTIPQVPQAIAFSPNSKSIAAGGALIVLESPPFLVHVWSVATGDERFTIDFHRLITALAFSLDGKWLAVAGRGSQTVGVYDTQTGHPVRQLKGPDAGGDGFALAFSPDGTRLAYGGLARSGYPMSNVATGRTLLVWDMNSGKALPFAPLPPDSGEPSLQTDVSSVAWTPDGQFLLAGAEDGMVRTWDGQSGKIVGSARLHQGDVSGLAVTPDGRRIVSAGIDGITCVAARSGEAGAALQPIVDLIAVDETGYLAATPDGYYRSSRTAGGAAAFRYQGRVYPFETFDTSNNRPDVLMERLGRADKAQISLYRSAYEKRCRRLGVPPDDALATLRQAPPLNVQSPPLYSKAAAVTLKVGVRAGTADLLVRVDNVPQTPVAVSGGGTVSVPVTLTAREGQVRGINRIDVTARSANGHEGLPETAYVYYDNDDPAKRKPFGDSGLIYSYEPVRQNLYLLMVGVSQYQTARYNLQSAARDARDLEAMLKSQTRRFQTIQTTVLTDNEATRERIKTEAHKLFALAGPNDQVIVFLGGHGMLTPNGDYYFGTYDVDFAHPEKSGLSYAEIEGLLDRVSARYKLLLMDTCHAGEVDPEQIAAQKAGQKGPALTANAPALGADGPRGVLVPETESGMGFAGSFLLMQEIFADIRHGNGAQVIAAAAGSEVAWEGEGNGVFTAAVLEGLRGRKADENGDGKVSVSELRDFVSHRVLEQTHGGQRPTARAESAEFDFMVLD